MRILVVKLSDIGDVLTVTPALHALRHSLIDARITALVPPSSAAVLEGSPLVDSLLIFDKFRFDAPLTALRPRQLLYALGLLRELRYHRFDCLILMHHLSTQWGALKFAALALTCGAGRRIGLDNGRGWFLTEMLPDQGWGHRHEVEYWLELVRLLGATTEGRHLEISVSGEDESFARRYLEGLHDGPLVALHVGGGGYSLARRWPAERFLEVARGLVQTYGAKVVLVGGAEEETVSGPMAEAIGSGTLNLTGRTTLKQLAAVLKRCQLFIGNDSGVMHLATAVDTPVIALFGPTNPKAWGPWAPEGKALILRADLPCSPCLYRDKGVGNRRGCSEMECLQGISVDMVLEAAARWLV